MKLRGMGTFKFNFKTLISMENFLNFSTLLEALLSEYFHIFIWPGHRTLGLMCELWVKSNENLA